MKMIDKVLFYVLFFFFSQVVCILPNNRKDKYDAVKKFLCVDCPTPSQCVVARTLSKPQALMTIATKIALQMNCKMGGELWSVEIPVSNFTQPLVTNYIYCIFSCVCLDEGVALYLMGWGMHLTIICGSFFIKQLIQHEFAILARYRCFSPPNS